MTDFVKVSGYFINLDHVTHVRAITADAVAQTPGVRAEVYLVGGGYPLLLKDDDYARFIDAVARHHRRIDGERKAHGVIVNGAPPVKECAS